ncbi:MAG: Spore coat protein CotH [Pseudarthrobacter sp.]|nr:Spore coat protein CotH [Pseudarthrobacter sp.]
MWNEPIPEPEAGPIRRSTGAILSSSALAVALALAGCGAGTGGTSTGSSATASATAGVEANGAETTTAGTTLFADGASHTVSITWNDDLYAAMIAAYEADGSEDWIKQERTEALRAAVGS